MSDDTLVGVIDCLNPIDRSYFAATDSEFLAAVAAEAATAISNARLHAATELQAITDSLTGIYNHGELHRRLAEEVARGYRYRHPVSLCFLDIDEFKAFNESYGHQMGDHFLQQVANHINQAVRSTDVVARYGGDEFAVILPETDSRGALTAAEGIRESVNSIEFAVEQGEEKATVRGSVSIGISTFPLHAQTPADLIDAADHALFQAKEMGKNTIRLWKEDVETPSSSPE